MQLQCHKSGIQAIIMDFFLYTPIHRSYTELFAGLSLEISPDKTGAWSASSVPLPLKLVADCVDFNCDLGPVPYSQEGY